MPEWLKKKGNWKTLSERKLSSACCHFRSIYMCCLALDWQLRIALYCCCPPPPLPALWWSCLLRRTSEKALGRFVWYIQPLASYPTSLETVVNEQLAWKFICSIHPNTGNNHVNAQILYNDFFNFVNKFHCMWCIHWDNIGWDKQLCSFGGGSIQITRSIYKVP